MFTKIAWVCAILFGYIGAASECGYSGAEFVAVTNGWACVYKDGYNGTMATGNCASQSATLTTITSGWACVCKAGYDGSLKPMQCVKNTAADTIEDEHEPEELLVATSGCGFTHADYYAITDGWACIYKGNYTGLANSPPPTNACGFTHATLSPIAKGWACLCNAGYDGTLKPMSCDPVKCPSGSSGVDIPSGCTCNAGYSGIITAKVGEPWFRLKDGCVKTTAADTIEDEHEPEELFASDCWAHSTQHNVDSPPTGVICLCNAGYTLHINGGTNEWECVTITAMEYAEETSEDQQKEDEAAEDANTIMISVAVGGLLTGAVAASAFVLKRRHATGRSEPLLEK